MHSLNENYKAVNLVSPQEIAASSNGSGVDTMGYGDDLVVILNTGAVSGTNPTLDVKLQECDTSGGTYTDISGATFGQVSAANKLGVQRVNLTGTRKRYIRAAYTLGGTSTPKVFASVVALLSAARASSSLNSSTPA